MIQTIITHECPRCGSLDLVKNGHDYKGDQKFHCKTCDRYGTLQAQKGYDRERRAQVKRALLERVSIRGIGRIFKMSRHTVGQCLSQWLEQQVPISQTLLPADWDDVLELDELWSFMGNKEQKRWLSLALCRRTHQVIAYWIGNRSETSAVRLWESIPEDYRHCASFSDRWQAYEHVFDRHKHRMVDKSEGETNHVERWFNTLRQRLARFTRKTLSFSKRDDIH
ncbi:IS1 family transposase [Phototrophicus methaneseepsis]|uniref:IS1 family transposase n=1 Tax=Phototrophicus methaneseepsis TaxID=2710758 RepID=A0A7S8EA24_9CHLR|nr:IS1 family transposase [Phototrophicus methaneseepsis]QPC83155.1 IS1 family transposase [Phototrophicus methaneseepsis]